jgi:hypothetical protein
MPDDKSKPLNGFYRAKVVNPDDPTDCGRVQVWIPDTMPKVDDSKGLWACPSNNPLGGLNADGDVSHQYQGTSYIPAKGSWIWVFFENGRADRPYYFASLDIANSKVLPENRVGGIKYKKWVIFKSHEGRTIVVSDDPDDCRVEITGKKRQLSDPPSGDTASVYTVDGNQTTILLDERAGKEKLLIRTHKGDFINIDIENQKLQIKFKSDITIESDGSIFFKAATDINIKAGANINTESGSIINNKAGGNINIDSGGTINNKAGGPINSDGSVIEDQCGVAGPATSAGESPPIGDR